MPRESWTDGRLDEFKQSVNRRFDEVDRRFDQVDRRFELVDQRFDKVEADIREGFARVDKDIRELRGEIGQIHVSLQALHRTMVHGVVGICGVMITGFVALAGIASF